MAPQKIIFESCKDQENSHTKRGTSNLARILENLARFPTQLSNNLVYFIYSDPVAHDLSKRRIGTDGGPNKVPSGGP